jgi:hypothetical protein
MTTCHYTNNCTLTLIRMLILINVDNNNVTN